MMYPIDSRFTIGSALPCFSEDKIKNEPMFWSATPRYAWENGGPITRAFLAAIFNITLSDYAPWVLRKADNYCFDSRVHMLMPGWFPCIPGWHHDDVPRSRGDGQPNYQNPEFHSKHIFALVNGDICPTEFAVGKTSMPHIPKGLGPVYKFWHNVVEQDIKEGTLERITPPSNHLIHFDWQSFHQGTKAVERGWRWFGRLTWDAGYEKGRPHHNEIRKQVQVYLDNPMEGW